MLYLVDASIYIFRSWQSLSSEICNRFGEPDNAVQGFAETLCQIIESRQPQYLVCAFDECYRQGVRNRLYPDYKADRPPAPPELAPQFGRCKQVTQLFGINALGSDLVEADDIIGQLAEIAQNSNTPVTIVSGDKDLAQFVTVNDRYWDWGRNQESDYNDLCQRFRIKPEQIPDWLAICGDRSDNIPGVPGVGASTSAKLLKKWGDLDTLLANLGQVADMHFRGAPRISRLLYEHKETIRLARSLTGLIRDDRLPQSMESCLRQQQNETELITGLYELGFEREHATRMAKRIAAA